MFGKWLKVSSVSRRKKVGFRKGGFCPDGAGRFRWPVLVNAGTREELLQPRGVFRVTSGWPTIRSLSHQSHENRPSNEGFVKNSTDVRSEERRVGKECRSR